jgi:hypothetical protein
VYVEWGFVIRNKSQDGAINLLAQHSALGTVLGDEMGKGVVCVCVCVCVCWGWPVST